MLLELCAVIEGSFALGDIKNIIRSFFVITMVTMQPPFLSSGMGAAPIPDDINTYINLYRAN